MARLYTKVDSDTGKRTTKTGNELIVVRIYYGSKKNSILAVKVAVRWEKDWEKPRLTVVRKI